MNSATKKKCVCSINNDRYRFIEMVRHELHRTMDAMRSSENEMNFKQTHKRDHFKLMNCDLCRRNMAASK